MAKRPPKTRRWSIVLAEALLLQGLATAAMAEDAPSLPANPALAADLADGSVVVGGDDLYLDVTLNGAPRGLAHFGYRNGELWASATTLRELGFILPQDTPDPLRLASLQGVQAQYDQARQRVVLVAPLKLLSLATTVVDVPQGKTPPASASPGLLLNYDLYGTRFSGGGGALSAYTELRAFNALGVLDNTALSRLDDSSQGRHGQSVRLDTTYSLAFPDRMVSVRLGDTITGAMPWSRATRIGGVQISRNFALQPYRITTPLPALEGSAALPSQVELYVNGLRQYTGQVPAGPFQLNTIPNISGSGSAQVVLTDALGRITTLDFSLYSAHELLQSGLSDWSAELGVVRQNYGLRSFDYGSDPELSGSWRRGLSDEFTLETHGEATRGLANAGVGGAWLIGRAGVLSGALARSSGRGDGGSQLNLGYNWRNLRFNFAVEGTRASSGYRDVASLSGAPLPQSSGRIVFGYTGGRVGSLGLSYLHLKYRDAPRSRYATAYWFHSLWRGAALNVNYNQNLDQSRDHSLYLGVSIALDGNISLSASAQRDDRNTTLGVDATSPLPSQGGYGWHAGARAGDGQNGGYAEVDHLGDYGTVAAGAYALGQSRYAYASADGSLVLMGGRPFAARRIDDAFAVVSTSGLADVPVKLENRPIGHTDSHGLLLVTPLNAYQTNALAIDPMDLPPDVRIQRVKASVTPADRAGTLVPFDIQPVRAALLTLMDAHGKPLPVGSEVRADGAAGEPPLVGFDGAVYLDALKPHNRLEVHSPDGVCSLTFDYPQNARGIAQIGPLACRKKTQ